MSSSAYATGSPSSAPLVGENNHGMSRSLYAKDPDGIELEVMWEVPLELYDEDDPSNVPLDLEADIERWGADRPGRGVPAASSQAS